MSLLKLKNKGYTLMELIIVLTILSIIFLFAQSNIINNQESLFIANIANQSKIIKTLIIDDINLKGFEKSNFILSKENIDDKYINQKESVNLFINGEKQTFDKILNPNETYILDKVKIEAILDDKIKGNYYTDNKYNIYYVEPKIK